jgi:hypothetical protein
MSTLVLQPNTKAYARDCLVASWVAAITRARVDRPFGLKPLSLADWKVETSGCWGTVAAVGIC